MTLCSCSDWFDVSPKTDVKAAELFESEDGFMEALAGIYVSMTDDAAYGDNLSFGMLDQMAQLYDMIPDGATDSPRFMTTPTPLPADTTPRENSPTHGERLTTS